MILIVVKQRIRAKFADDWLTLVEPFTTGSRAEPGCISFDWYRSSEDPQLWVLVEAYADAAAGQAHVESDHFKAATQSLPGWLAAAPEIIHVDGRSEGWTGMAEI